MGDAKPMTDEELGAIGNRYRYVSASHAYDVGRLLDEVRRLRASPAMRREADHQRAALESHGLAGEFGPMGCDAICGVAAALLACRAEGSRLRAECVLQWRKESQLNRHAFDGAVIRLREAGLLPPAPQNDASGGPDDAA